MKDPARGGTPVLDCRSEVYHPHPTHAWRRNPHDPHPTHDTIRYHTIPHDTSSRRHIIHHHISYLLYLIFLIYLASILHDLSLKIRYEHRVNKTTHKPHKPAPSLSSALDYKMDEESHPPYSHSLL